MDKIIKHLNETLPQSDSFFSLLIFLLMVFGALYVLFQLIFYLSEHKKEKPKKEPKKKEQTSTKAELNEVKEDRVEEKREKHRKAKVENSTTNGELIFLEEEKPYVEVRPQYLHEHNDSYVVGKYNSEVKDYCYGNNYLYDYYNNGKTSNINTISNPIKEDIRVGEEREQAQMKAKTDELVNTYSSLPTELKRYILEKILSSSK